MSSLTVWTKIGEPSGQGWTASHELIRAWDQKVFTLHARRFPRLGPAIPIADAQGLAEGVFRSLWRQAFGSTLSLTEPILSEGYATDYLVDVFNR